MASLRFDRWRRDFFSLNPQRKTKSYLLQPSRQLRLPLYLLGITVGFGALWIHSAASAIRELYTAVESAQPRYFDAMIQSQLHDLALVSLLIALPYVLVTIAVAVVHSHQYVGPAIPLRRHLEALKNGDYSSRVQLRRGDAFEEVAQDLNELAALLADREKQR